MNPFERTIAFFSPQRALGRARAKAALSMMERLYEGAQPGRRGSSWRSRASSQNTEMATAITPLRDRARDMVRNSPWAPRMLDVLVAHTIGTGLRPVPDTGDDNLDIKVSKLWAEWNAEADVEGNLTFDAMQRLALRSTIESGEIVCRYIDQPLRGKGRLSKTPVKVQLLEGDFIDHQRDGQGYADIGLGVTKETERSRLGVGLGKYDVRTGLWLFPYHPGEITTTKINNVISTFVTQDQFTHMFRTDRPGQVRGTPWFAPIMMMQRDLSDFMDALIVKARVEACFSGFITNMNEFENLMDATPDSFGFNSFAQSSNPDAMVSTLEPGMLKELKQGQDIKFAQPTSAGQVEPVMMNCLMALAAAVGCTYDQVTGDLRGANYSSLRAGKIDFRKLVEQHQEHMVKPRLCMPVWRRFISRNILAGELPERDKGYPVSWVTPAWESINPKFDQNAEELSVRAGRMSPQEFIAEWGYDWRKVQDDFAAFYKRADEKGLVFDIDPRKVTKAGGLQPPPVAPGAAGPNGAAAGATDGLTDGDGNTIDPQDLQDLIDTAAEGGRGVPFHFSTDARRFLRQLRYSEDQPRDEDGRWTDGGGSEGGVADEASAAAHFEAPGTSVGSQKTLSDKVKVEDFAKDGVTLPTSKGGQDKLLADWEQHVDVLPGEFKKEFLGGVNATMNLNVSGDRWLVEGQIKNADDRTVGSYQRVIDWQNKTAESAYFQLRTGWTGDNVGKKLLAGNVAMYQKLGLKSVSVHANIDVGGYAWAKYGYVPTLGSWHNLANDLSYKLDGSSRGSSSSSSDGYRDVPGSWDEIGSDNQQSIEEAWMRDTYDEFLQSEVDNWRENGDALDQAKTELVEKDDWIRDVIADLRTERDDNGKPNFPYTEQQLIEAIDVTYDSGNEGQGAFEVSFDDDKLKEPTDLDKDQMDLPGIDVPDPALHLTEAMREEITHRLEVKFDKEADDEMYRLDPPDYISDSVSEYQTERWSDMSDRERYRWASDHGQIESVEREPEEDEEQDAEPVAVGGQAKDDLKTLIASDNPKAIWAVADSARGKELLLGTDWSGKLSFSDKESMDRFNAYVGKGKQRAA
jgi:lambda family phage portal protein